MFAMQQIKDPLPSSRQIDPDEVIKVMEKESLSPEKARQTNKHLIARAQHHRNIISQYSQEGVKNKLQDRLFIDKYVILDNDNNPFPNHYTGIRQFLPFYQLGTSDFFGGRVIIAESSVTMEGKNKNQNGTEKILPSQLTVIADSNEVEVLIMDKNLITFFPEDV